MSQLETIELWLWLRDDLEGVRHDDERGKGYIARDRYDNEARGNLEAAAIQNLWHSVHK